MLEENNQMEAVEESVEVTIQSLLESGAHFGSKKGLWNPKSARYIYGIRNDIYIINLETTIECWSVAKQAIKEVISNNGTMLVVGTKEKIRNEVINTSTKSGCFYVSHRWLGGTLTNLETLRKSITKMEKLEATLVEAEAENSTLKLTKKEILLIKREVAKLNKFFNGLRKMTRLPDLIFITDVTKDSLALLEANKLQIPVIAIVDTNVDPTLVTYPIPANDDSNSAQILFLKAIRDVVLEGRTLQEEERLIEEKTNVERAEENTDSIKQQVSEVIVEYRK